MRTNADAFAVPDKREECRCCVKLATPDAALHGEAAGAVVHSTQNGFEKRLENTEETPQARPACGRGEGVKPCGVACANNAHERTIQKRQKLLWKAGNRKPDMLAKATRLSYQDPAPNGKVRIAALTAAPINVVPRLVDLTSQCPALLWREPTVASAVSIFTLRFARTADRRAVRRRGTSPVLAMHRSPTSVFATFATLFTGICRNGMRTTTERGGKEENQ